MDTKKIIERLALMHDARNEAFFVELRLGGGFHKDSMQRLDGWAIDYRPTKCNKTTSYEFKISRSDFFNEIKKPNKRKAGLRLSNEFYFVTPKGLVKQEEVPPECGLIEISDDGEINYTIKAPYRNILPPTFNFVASICRRFDKDRLDEFMKYYDANHKLNEEGNAVMMALDSHIQKWEDYNLGNKEVPDKIAAALEDLKNDVAEILEANKLIK